MALIARMTLSTSRALQQYTRHYSGSISARSLSTWSRQSIATKFRGSHLAARTGLLLCASSAATAALITNRTPGSLLSVAMADYSTSAATSATTISSIRSSSMPDVVLYQFEVCPFCNKVRAYLDYHNVPYRVVEVDPLRKTELKELEGDYKKVPIAIINDKQFNGSSAVIDALDVIVRGQRVNEKTVAEAEPRSNEEKEWIDWLDNHLIHLIAPNIYRTPSESLQTFNYIADKSKFSAWQRATIRYTGAAAMYMIGKRLKKKYDIKDEREAIHEAVKDWMAAIRKGGGMYLDGKNDPGVADLSVYGVLKAIETFDTFMEVRERNGEFAEWFDRTKQVVGESSETQDI